MPGDEASAASVEVASASASNPMAPFPRSESEDDEPPAMVIQDPEDASYDITRAMPSYRKQKRGSQVLDALMIQEEQTRTLQARLAAARSEGERLKCAAAWDPIPPAPSEGPALPLDGEVRALQGRIEGDLREAFSSAARRRTSSSTSADDDDDAAPASSCWSKAGSRRWQEPPVVPSPRPSLDRPPSLGAPSLEDMHAQHD